MSEIAKACIDQIEQKLPSLLPWQLTQFEKAIAAAADAATNPAKCRSCNASIIWGKTEAGKVCPFDYNTGESHFKTCPQATAWSKESKLGRTRKLNNTPEIFSQSLLPDRRTSQTINTECKP